MQHDIYLRTIPHTGTRFVSSILDDLGVKHQQWHIFWPEPHDYIDFDDSRVMLDNVPRVHGVTRYIVTVRDPYETWESMKYDGRAWPAACAEFYDELMSLVESKEKVFILPLDVIDKQQAIADLADFCGVEYDGSITWRAQNLSGCNHGDCPAEARKGLSDAYQWYSHHTDRVNQSGLRDAKAG